MAVFSVLAADAITTSRIRHRPDLIEGGPLASRMLGDNPQTAETLAYMATLGFIYHISARRMPPRMRKFFQFWTISVHADAAATNCGNNLC